MGFWPLVDSHRLMCLIPAAPGDLLGFCFPEYLTKRMLDGCFSSSVTTYVFLCAILPYHAQISLGMVRPFPCLRIWIWHAALRGSFTGEFLEPAVTLDEDHLCRGCYFCAWKRGNDWRILQIHSAIWWWSGQSKYSLSAYLEKERECALSIGLFCT